MHSSRKWARANLKATNYLIAQLLFVALVLIGCKRSDPTDFSKSRPILDSATKSLQAGKTTVEAIIMAWREAATSRKLPAHSIEIVADELRDVLDYAKVKPEQRQVDLCKQPFERILDSQTMLYEEQNVKGSARWIAWCTAEALTRHSMSDEEWGRICADYHEFAKEFTGRMRIQLLDRIPKEKQAGFITMIDDGLMLWRRNMDIAINFIEKDFLFPALREPLSREVKDKVFAKYDNPKKYPKWNKPSQVMWDSNEEYRMRFRSWLRNSLDDTLFFLSLEQLKPRLKFNEYWGYCLLTALGTHGAWPLEAQLEIFTQKNETTEWKRARHD